SLKAALYGGLAARLASVPVVWHARDRIADDYLPRSAVRIVRAAARTFATAVVADTKATLATLPGIEHGYVVPSPIPSQDRAPHEPGPLRIGMIGRIAEWKGQHVFIEAFARAFESGPELAVIIGAPLFGWQDEEY